MKSLREMKGLRAGWWVSCDDYDLGPFKQRERAVVKLDSIESRENLCRNKHTIIYGQWNSATGSVDETGEP